MPADEHPQRGDFLRPLYLIEPTGGKTLLGPLVVAAASYKISRVILDA